MRNILFVLFFSVPFFAMAQDADSTSGLSLEKCVGFALRNNVNINNSDYQSQMNGVYYLQAKAQVYPGVNASVSHQLNSGRNINTLNNSYSTQSFTSANYGLNAGMTLWNGFRLQNYIRKTALDNEAGKMDLQNQRDMITLQVIVAYLDVLNQEDQLDNYKQQLLSTQAQLNRLDSMNVAGAAKPDDIASMQAQLKGYEVSVLQQEDAIKTAKITLFGLMNIPLNLDAVLDRPKSLTEVQTMPVQSIDDIYARAVGSLPGIKEAELKQQSAYKNIQVAKGSYYPTLSLNGGISTNYSSTATTSVPGATTRDSTGLYVLNGGSQTPVYQDVTAYSYSKIGYFNQLKNNYGIGVGVTLSIPIFNGLQARSDVKLAKIAYSQAAFTTNATKNQLRSTIGQYVSDVNAALQSLDKQQQTVDAYKELVRVDQIKFNEGALDATGFLVAKTQLQQAEINLIVMKYTYIFKSKILSYYQGQLSF